VLPCIVHIVKRFGPVGGMEIYVWRLVHGLAQRGCCIYVVCEEVVGHVDSNIRILLVDKTPAKPRWKSMLTFRDRVSKLIKDRFKEKEIIVHSHERSLSHQVTTFHGPPINTGVNCSWLKKFSPRIRAWIQMERDELLSASVDYVLPVSSKVLEILLFEYPQVNSKRIKLVWPGVDRPNDHKDRKNIHTPSTRFIFVGKEWKRKGLGRAIDILVGFRNSNRQATLDVYGVTPQSVPKQMRSLSWVNFKGWSETIPWKHYAALIHPAEIEPFGMVIAEARANGISVIMSDQVGASDLSFSNVAIVDINSPIREWVSQLNLLLTRYGLKHGEVKWTWDDLVDLHFLEIYPRVNVATKTKSIVVGKEAW